MGETAEQQRIRGQAVHLLDLAIPRLEQILRLRMLVYGERAVPGGVRFGQVLTETWAVRERGIRWVLSRLHALRQRLVSGPVPDLWQGEITATGRNVYVGQFPPSLREVYLSYYHFNDEQGVPEEIDGFDTGFAVRFIEAILGSSWSLDRTHLTGINVVVRDPVNHPDEVQPLLPFGPVNGTILELWRDSPGNLFYNFHGRRRYVDADRLRLPGVGGSWRGPNSAR
ncbi:MAG TPA: hypothetical protein VLJ18_07340 [Thermoanaerobaculia bacterium]|nr:hypothetical protein [Thermoanaerobaculia bacterium]